MCSCPSVYMCIAHLCGWPRGPEENVGTPGAGVPGNSQLLNMVLERTQILSKGSKLLNHPSLGAHWVS